MFRKTINVWIDTYGEQVFSNLVVNGVQISRIQCILQPDGTLFIGDILPYRKKNDYHKGYGTLMMAELLRYSSQIGVNTIRGKLSSVDYNHKNRLHMFYKKHGFEIVEYDAPEDSFYGEIIKKL